MSNIRDAELSQLLSGMLGRLSPPRGIANSERAMGEEVAALAKALSRAAPAQGYRAWFDDFADALASRAKTRAWPIVSEIESAAKAVADRSAHTSSGPDNADFYEIKAVERMADWFGKFRSQMPSHGKPSRTAALIRQGVLRDLREARFCGFDLSDEQMADAVAMPMGPDEARHHNAITADLMAIAERNASIAAEIAAKRRIVKHGEAA